jgi:hypothetical protein
MLPLQINATKPKHIQQMKTKNNITLGLVKWIVSDIRYAANIGNIEAGEEYFELLETKTKVVFGGSCNTGFLESGYILKDDCESLNETLQELHADLETFYRDGAQYVSRIVFNDRM